MFSRRASRTSGFRAAAVVEKDVVSGSIET
jgi:hypothetical protein